MSIQMENNDVANCLNKIRNGDNSAYVILLDRYDDMLYKFMAKVSEGVLNDFDIRDIVQDTWCEVYEKNSGVDPEKWYKPEIASFYTYIANIAIIGLKKRKTQLKGSVDIYNGGDEEGRTIIDTFPEDYEKTPEAIVVKKDGILFKLRVKMELLRIVLLCGGYPHQQLAFIITKFLNGKRSQRAMEGKISVVYEDFPEIKLESVYQFALLEIEKNKDIGEYAKEIVGMMEPIKLKFPFTIFEMTKMDKNKTHYKEIFDLVIGESCFKDYYQLSKTSQIEKSKEQISGTITNWIEKIRRKTCRLIEMPEVENSSLFDKEFEDVPIVSEHKCKGCILKTMPPCK